MIYVDIKKDYGAFKLEVKFKSDKGILGLLGESGSGKSLSLKSIAGIEKPDYGKIILNDRVLFDSEKKYKFKDARQKSRLSFPRLRPISKYDGFRKHKCWNQGENFKR